MIYRRGVVYFKLEGGPEEGDVEAQGIQTGNGENVDPDFEAEILARVRAASNPQVHREDSEPRAESVGELAGPHTFETLAGASAYIVTLEKVFADGSNKADGGIPEIFKNGEVVSAVLASLDNLDSLLAAYSQTNAGELSAVHLFRNLVQALRGYIEKGGSTEENGYALLTQMRAMIEAGGSSEGVSVEGFDEAWRSSENGRTYTNLLTNFYARRVSQARVDDVDLTALKQMQEILDEFPDAASSQIGTNAVEISRALIANMQEACRPNESGEYGTYTIYELNAFAGQDPEVTARKQTLEALLRVTSGTVSEENPAGAVISPFPKELMG